MTVELDLTKMKLSNVWGDSHFIQYYSELTNRCFSSHVDYKHWVILTGQYEWLQWHFKKMNSCVEINITVKPAR